MRELPVDLGELAVAMEDHGDYHAWHLDAETGEVVPLPGPFGEPEALPEEIREEYERILEEEPDRLRPVPRISSERGYRWMVRFAESVGDEDLRRLLRVALDGKGAFGRFKRVLSDHPEARERWFRFHDERVEAEAREWLEWLEIEPVPGDPS